MISWSTSAKRLVAWCNLSAKWTPMRVPESRLSNLRVDPPLDCQSVVVANACAARFSLSFVVNGTAELGSWSSTSTFTSDGTAWVWLGIMYGWLGGKERRSQREHEEHVVLSMNAWDQPNKTEQDTSSSVTCRCLLEARTYDTLRSDFRHLEGVWNFRRIVFHASLQVESSCYRFFRNFAAALRDMTSVSARFY